MGDDHRPNQCCRASDCEEQIDLFEQLGISAQTAGEAIGKAFADMARGVDVSVGDMLKRVGLLIAKLLIMSALSAIPGIGGLLSGVAGGLFAGFGFDNPIDDTKAFRWGMDFTRQFGAGMNSMLGNGLGLPKMEPAPVAGGMGQPTFEVQIFEPGPDTYAKVVRKGVDALGTAGRLGLMRNGLGRAKDDWDGR